MYMYVVVCYKHVLEDTDCYGGYLNKSCILYLVSIKHLSLSKNIIAHSNKKCFTFNLSALNLKNNVYLDLTNQNQNVFSKHLSL